MNILAILNTIKVYLLQMLPWAVAVLPAYLIVRAIIIMRRSKKAMACFSWKREIGLALFCLCMIFILSATVLPEVSLRNGINVYYPGGGFSTDITITDESLIAMLTPGNIFDSIGSSFQYYGGMTLWLSILGKIMLFVPLGFLFSMMFSESIKINLLFGAGLSLLIELYQLFIPRATDIDDLWLNVLGMLIGCILLRLIRKRRRRKQHSLIETEH